MYLNLAHYFFTPIADPAALKARLERRLTGTSIVGTILIAPEGTNCNLAGLESELLAFADEYFGGLGCGDLDYRLGHSADLPYRHRKIRIKPEIVTMGIADLDVAGLKAPPISPEEFRALVRDPGDTVILDTRNEFEVEMGTFVGSTSPRMRTFRDFPAAAERLEPSRPVVMFCTGGIRCEKASAYLRARGFENVRQLDGGILRYLNRFGKDGFRGECFVFDERVRYTPPGASENANEVEDGA